MPFVVPKEAARPQIPASEEDTQRTDFQEGSGAVHGRSVARWHIPRPAGLGWAARPHLAASRLPASRGSQALPPEITIKKGPWHTINRTPSPHL